MPRVGERSLQFLQEALLGLLREVAFTEGLGQLVDVHPQLQLGDGLTPQRVQRGLLIRRKFPRNAIQYAEAPEGVAVMCDERRAGVEAHAPRLAADERTILESLVGERVRDHEQAVLLNRVGTKRDGASGFCRADADA